METLSISNFFGSRLWEVVYRRHFYSLVRHLYETGKLKMVLSPYIRTCSQLLKIEAKEKINYMDNLHKKIGINEKAPHADETT